MKTWSLKKKKVIAIIVILLCLPIAIACAYSGGSLIAYVFATVLAIGVDMLLD